MALSEHQLQTFRELASVTEGIDVEVYQRFDKNPLEPVGLQPSNARVGIFGRDPGRDEILHGEGFIGAGGQMVRRALYQQLHGAPMPDFAASVEVGRHFFWANTVPYKPVGNKAWSTKVKQRFHPAMRQLIVDNWHGDRLITLGREAFLWFAMNQTPDVRAQVEQFWLREHRFSETLAVRLTTEAGHSRQLHLYPLPHPSPLNATWYKRFPALLLARLQQLDVRLDNLVA